jgi:hypothetical protein
MAQTVRETTRFPLSYNQEMWCGWPAAFNPRFVIAEAMRVRGYVDVAALQRALDDLVRRHAILRTFVVRDGDEPYQEVYPPGPVTLEVRDLPAGADREEYALKLLAEAELASVDLDELPLLRAMLCRFDHRDSVLSLVTHHTAADGWSMDLLKRDLAACYAARAAGTEPDLPEVRQYGEFTLWQREHLATGAGAAAEEYWREQLGGKEVFTMPTDRPISDDNKQDYVANCYVVDAALMKSLGEFATEMRSSMFMVLMAAMNVLAHRVDGSTDQAIFAMSAGRGQRAYRDTIGPFLDFVVLRTDFSDCVTFRDLVRRTRTTCLGAQAHELPMRRVEQLVPELNRPLENPNNCDFSFGFSRPVVSGEDIRIADGASSIRQPEQESTGAPGGLVWTMGVIASGEALGKVQFNPGEFNPSTVDGWVSTYRRVLARAIEAPDREWKTL